MQAIKLTAEVSERRELRPQLPDSVAPGPFEVLILSEDVGTKRLPSNQAAILATMQRLAGKYAHASREEIDERLRRERDSWE